MAKMYGGGKNNSMTKGGKKGLIKSPASSGGVIKK